MSIDWSSYPNFSEHEFTCPCGCNQTLMDEAFLAKLQEVRTEYGKPMTVSSGYRCPKHNADIGGGPEHPLGKAADILVRGKEAHELMRIAPQHFPRIGVQQRGGGRFLHLGNAEADEVDGFSPWVWSY